jgi:glycosyltransferase involved in cell wall biosynthesis
MKVYQWGGSKDKSEYGHIYRAANQPGVNMHGSVPQPDLLRAAAAAGFLLYPNTFQETSCIAAIEAQANGAVVVTSANAGLNETVENGKTGICLAGAPASREYQSEFVRTVCGLLANRERLQELSANARKRAFERYTWDVVAREWIDLFETMETKAVHSRYDGPIVQLEKAKAYARSGNVAAARRALVSIQDMPYLKAEVTELQNALTLAR